MGQSADQLRDEIAAKRSDAAQKIDAIQAQVEGTVQQVQDSVEGTVQQVQDTVQDTVEQVKENLDIRHQIEERPLLALGAALIAGFALGSITGGGNEQQQQSQTATWTNQGQGQSQPPAQQGGGITGTIEHLAKESGLESTISDMASAFMATMTDRMKRSLDQSFPGFASKFQQAQRSGGDFAAKTNAAEGTTAATTDASGRPVAYYPNTGVTPPNVHD